MRLHCNLALPFVILLAPAIPVQAADVTFSGLIVNSCVLNPTTPGVIAPTADGTVLGSDTAGGSAAILGVVAVGTVPTIAFTAPALTTPAGYSGSATPTIRYVSTGGANQAYTSGASSAHAGVLLDSFTINARVTGLTGFTSGTYSVRTTVTCQQ